MFESIKTKLIRILAPGIEDVGKEEIKFIIGRNNSVRIDIDSFRRSKAIEKQIESIRNEEKRAV